MRSASQVHSAEVTVPSVFVYCRGDIKEFQWPASKTIGEAAAEASKAFDYARPPDVPHLQDSNDLVLQQADTFAKIGAKDGDSFFLIAIGGNT
jgi:hypothetical protein